jgi:hypothetical protein
LASNYSRDDSKHAGTCICVHEDVKFSEVNYLEDIKSANDFEMSVIELVDFKMVDGCIILYCTLLHSMY